MDESSGALLVFGTNWLLSSIALTYADVDGDGFDDIVAAAASPGDPDQRAMVVVVYGGRPRFAGTIAIDSPDLVLFEPGWDVLELVAADFDGDGLDDLAIAGHGGPTPSSIRIVYGDATRRTGVVALADVAATLLPSGGEDCGTLARAGDLDGDGIDDLAVNVGGPSVAGLGILHGRAERFAGTVPLVLDTHLRARGDGVDPLAWWAGAAGDVDGDGHDDLLVGTRSDSSPRHPYTLYWIYGPVPRGDVEVSTSGASFANLASGRAVGELDANGDGLSDFMLLTQAGTTILVLGSRARFDGEVDDAHVVTFPPPCTAIGGVNPWSSRAYTAFAGAAGDVDGDGNSDLFLAYPNLSTVPLMPSAWDCPSATRAHLVFGDARIHDHTAIRLTDSAPVIAAQDGDLDGDGLADTIFATFDDGRFHVIHVVYGAPR